MHQELAELLARIDEAIENDDAEKALSLVLGNWNNLPDPGPLRERTALIFATEGKNRQAVDILDLVARHYANAGFPTRALAATKQLQELNPSSTQLLDHFTTLYSVRSPFLERELMHPSLPAPADELEFEVDGPDEELDELLSTAYDRATSAEGTAERPGSLPALPLLSLLPPKALRRLLDFLEYEIYAEPEPISGPDTDEDALLWTVSTDLTVSEDEERFRVPAGALIGLDEYGDSDHSPRHTVAVQKGSECLRLSYDDVASLTDEFPDFPNRLATLRRHALTEGLFESHPMFEGLDDDLLEQLPSRLTGLKLDADATLVRQDKVSPGLYVLLDGSIDIVREGDEDQIVDTVGPGDMVGEIGLVDPQPAYASAITAEPSYVLFFSREEFVDFADQHPPAADVANQRAEKRAEMIQVNT